jgi:D-alanyl-lipoteichoic acid acyltransferase DltB (MBOAT superfamily)
MLFHRVEFFIFFGVVLVLYNIMTLRAQNIVLLIGSYIFYGAWDWRFLGLLFASTVVDFSVGWALGTGARKRKLWLLLSIVTNLGILGYFKYRGFFADSFSGLMSSFGWDVDARFSQIILPVGISFYTFQSMSYTIDVFWGKTRPCIPDLAVKGAWPKIRSVLKEFNDFALYVAFFPQLVAGPIERSTRLLKQVQKKRDVTYQGVADGCWLFLLGLVMKVAMADEIAPFVNSVFHDVSEHSFLKLYAAAVGFTIQIYCDFAGYSLMARGAARILGFDLMVNFRVPFLSDSFSDLWKRWHISLSSWIRDYVYIPLGGSRGTAFAVNRNLLIAMILAGLWHGPTWAYAFWGGLHGLFLIIERLFKRSPDSRDPGGKPRLNASAWLSRFVVLQGWIFGLFIFRLGDLDTFWSEISALWSSMTFGSLADLPLSLPDGLAFVFFGVLFCIYEVRCWWHDRDLYPRDFGPATRFLLYAILFAILLAAGGEKDAPFIYFQF